MLSRLKSRLHHFTGAETEGLGGNRLPNVSAAHSDLLCSTCPVEYSWNCAQRAPGLEVQFSAGELRQLQEAGPCWKKQFPGSLGVTVSPTPVLFQSCRTSNFSAVCSRCHDEAKATINQNNPSLYLFIVSYFVPEMRKGSNTSTEKLPLLLQKMR